MMTVRKVRQEECEIRVIPEYEYLSPEDGYDPDRIISRSIYHNVEDYGLWGWCSVKVEARFGPLVGVAYLGGCSYKDEEDFKMGGYYEQLVEEALDDINQQITRLAEKLG